MIYPEALCCSGSVAHATGRLARVVVAIRWRHAGTPDAEWIVTVWPTDLMPDDPAPVRGDRTLAERRVLSPETG